MRKGFRDPKGTLLAPDEWRQEDSKHAYRLIEDTVDLLDYIISQGWGTHGHIEIIKNLRARYKERNW